jgi:hypothetical protein
MRKRNGNGLPPIAVEEETVSLRLSLPKALSDEVDRYAQYFEKVTGRKPLSQQHVIEAVLKHFFADGTDFQRWKAEHSNGGALRNSPYPPAAARAARE